MTDKEMVQKQLLQVLATNEGATLARAYFKAAIYRGDSKVSMAGLLQLLGITCIRWSGVVIYAKNDKESLPAVDRQLQAEFEGFKRTLLFFSPAERKVLRACGTDERMVALNAMSR